MASALIGSLRVTLGLDTAEFQEGVKRARKELGGFQKTFTKVGTAIQGAGAALTLGLTAPFIAFGKSAITAASDAEELQAAFNTTFGSMAGDMSRWAQETGDAMGRSTQQMQQGANAFGLFFNQAAPTRKIAAEMSKTFSVLAQDLASFHNATDEEALLALRSGLSGETEPLRRFGVFLNEAAVKAKALEIGLKPLNGKLTDQQKIMARAAIILEKTADAQGDVIRTSDSHANRVRAAQAAWQELQVTVGSELIPALQPLIKTLTDLANGFSKLSPEAQSFAIGAAAIGAALGPVLLGLGTVMKLMAPAITSLVAWTSTAITTAAATTATGTAMSGLGVILRGLLPMLGPIAIAAGAIYLAWQNWDKIGPILQDVWNTVQQTLGPPLQEVFNVIKEVVSEVWSGPFGQEMRAVMPVLQEFGKFVLQVFGIVLVKAVKAAGEVVKAVARIIGTTLTAIGALLRGDFSAAWEACKQTVVEAVNGIGNVIYALVPKAIDALSRLVRVIQEWMINKLNAVWEGVRQKVDQVKQWFWGLYDAVVGHSYVPDMVNGIATWMAKLDAVMAQPAKKATDKTRQAFEHLGSIMERLFPEEMKARQFALDLAFLEQNAAKLGLTADQTAEAIKRLHQELYGADFYGGIEVPVEIDDAPLTEGLDAAQARMEDWLERMEPVIDEGLGGPMKRRFEELGHTINDTIITGLKGMMRGAVSWKEVMLEALFAIGDALIDMVLQPLMQGAGGAPGGIGGAIAAALGSIFGGGFAEGGRPPMGKISMVGERGPELFVPDTAGTVIPNHSLGGPVAKVELAVVEGEMFEARVTSISDGVVLTRAPAIVSGTKAGTMRSLVRPRMMNVMGG